jgi:hypothetical protein
MDELEFSLIPRNAAGERIDNCDAPVAAFVRRVAASGAKSSGPGGARRSGSRGRRVESDAEVNRITPYSLLEFWPRSLDSALSGGCPCGCVLRRAPTI